MRSSFSHLSLLPLPKFPLGAQQINSFFCFMETSRLEEKMHPNGWILAHQSATSGGLLSNASPSGDPFGLMQEINSNWITFNALTKQQQHHSDLQANPLLLPISLTDKHRAPAESPAFGKISEPKTPRFHVPFTYGMNRSFPLLCYNPGDFISMPTMTSKEMMDAKALAASKSHSEAERRRRERINTHLATLRSRLPGTIKTDKASLLAEVVHHLKDLKRKAAELARISSLPTAADELHVDTDSSLGDDRVLIRASLCCDDRPGLLSDLIRAIEEMKLHTTKIEIVALGGRVKNVIFMTAGNRPSSKQEGLSVTGVQDALRAVIEKSASSELTAFNFFTNKRQRISHYGSSQV